MVCFVSIAKFVLFPYHKIATSSMKEFLFTLAKNKKKVNYWLNNLDRKKFEKNRLVTKSLTKIILIMTYQCFVFHGSDDSVIKGKIEEKIETSKYKSGKPRKCLNSC